MSVWDDIGLAFKIGGVALKNLPLVEKTFSDGWAAYEADKIAITDILALWSQIDGVINPPGSTVTKQAPVPADPNLPAQPSPPGTTADTLNAQELAQIEAYCKAAPWEQPSP